MNNMERWGLELALLIRRQDAARTELTDVTEKIDQICAKISNEPTGTLYGNQTGEHPELQVERNAVGWTVSASGDAAQLHTPHEKPRNQAPVPMARPAREDRPDGGSTFHFTPIGDNVAETAQMPAVLQCPRTIGGECRELQAHIHTSEGVQRVADIGS